MSNLEYLEAGRDFRSYFRTLRDLNFYLRNSPELTNEQIQTATLAITRLIYDFIGVDGTTFRDMDQEIYGRVYQMFKADFLAIIQNSGENDVDFDTLADLLDEMLDIANLRSSALERIPGAKQQVESPNQSPSTANGDVSEGTVEAVQNETEVVPAAGSNDGDPEAMRSGNVLADEDDAEDSSDTDDFLNEDESIEVRVNIAVTDDEESSEQDESNESYQYHDQSDDYKVFRRRRYE